MSAVTVNEQPAGDVDVVDQRAAALTVDFRRAGDLALTPGTASAVTLASSSAGGAAFTLNALAEMTQLHANGGGGLTVDVSQASPTDIAPGTASAVILGIDGTPGPRGPAGPPGAGTGGFYRHTQTIAADTWLVLHQLGFNPNAAVTDTAGSLVYADEVVHIDVNTLQLTFSEPLAGAAFLS